MKSAVAARESQPLSTLGCEQQTPGTPSASSARLGWAHLCVCVHMHVCACRGDGQDHLGTFPNRRCPQSPLPHGPPGTDAAEAAAGQVAQGQALHVGDVAAVAAATPGSKLSSPCFLTGLVFPQPQASECCYSAHSRE